MYTTITYNMEYYTLFKAVVLALIKPSQTLICKSAQILRGR